MPRFIAIHPMTFTGEQLAGLAEQGRQAGIPEGVAWHGAWCGESVAYCDWTAPDAGTVEGMLTQMNVPFTAVQEVRQFDPQAGRFAD